MDNEENYLTDKTIIRRIIYAEKTKLFEDGVEDLECAQIRDILERAVSNCVGADHFFDESQLSELTMYREFATPHDTTWIYL